MAGRGVTAAPRSGALLQRTGLHEVDAGDGTRMERLINSGTDSSLQTAWKPFARKLGSQERKVVMTRAVITTILAALTSAMMPWALTAQEADARADREIVAE